MTTRPDRRDVLRGASALAGLSLTAPWSAASQQRAARGSPLLVAVFLRGGADFLNMVAPVEDKLYRDVRPTIGLAPEGGAVPLDDGFALHPALAPLEPLWREKRLAPIVCTGSPHDTRSHFSAQDFMERGAPGMPQVTTGWLDRYLVATAKRDSSEFRAVALQPLLPRSLRGDHPALAVAPEPGRAPDEGTLGEFEDLYGGGAMDERREGEPDVIDSGRVTIETLRRYREIVEGAGEAKEARYPRSRFATALRTVAALQRAECGLEVVALDYNGWDHHIGQGGAEGQQARMLGDYAASLAAFCRDLGPRLDQTLVVTMTEFGRTVRENGNGGSDHGRGSGMFLLGGRVRGGRVHGTWKGLAEKNLADGRDLPVTTDFRDVFADCLDAHLGFDPPRGFFPEHKPRSTTLF